MHLATDERIAQSLLRAAREGAVFSNHADPASKLVNAIDGKGQTPLMMACMAGHYPLAKLLLSNGADPLSCDDKSMNVLHFCQEGGNPGCTLLILKNIGLWGRRGPQASQVKAPSNRNRAAVRAAEASGLVNAPDSFGRTPLHYSVYYGSVESTRALIGEIFS